MGADPRRRDQARRPGLEPGRGRVLGRPVLVDGRGGGAPVGDPGRGWSGRPGGRPAPGRTVRSHHPRGPGGGGAGRSGLRPARVTGSGAGRVGRDRSATSPPAGPDPGTAGRRLLRRPRPGKLRRPPPARGGQVRGHGHPDHGWLHPRLPAPRVPGGGQALPAHRPDRPAHALCGRGLAHGEPAGRIGMAAGPFQGPRRRP